MRTPTPSSPPLPTHRASSVKRRSLAPNAKSSPELQSIMHAMPRRPTRAGEDLESCEYAYLPSLTSPPIPRAFRAVLAILVLAVVMLGYKVVITERLLLEQQSYGPEGVSQLVDREVGRRMVDHLSRLDNAQGLGKVFPPTKTLPEALQKRIVVTGGAGFVGSHLVDRLMEQGHQVIVLDNFFTGRKKNIQHWIGHPHFELIVHDVVDNIMLEVDQIYHLACPASPPHYQYNPIKTIKTSTQGTLNMLGLAKRVGARMLLTSTSEVYGDPRESPQKESYWGNVNPIGPRACYDEGKRVAETMMYAYHNQGSVEVRVVRIFNTFGPRMHPNDGRVVSNFIIQCLQGKDVTIYGDGSQTRSFQYVDDLVEGLMMTMEGSYDQPINIGNPDEYTIKQFAEMIRDMTGSKSQIKHLPATEDDPKKRKPDISVARKELGWVPKVSVREGLTQTIKYFQRELEQTGEILPTGPEAVKPGMTQRMESPPGPPKAHQ